MFSPCAPGGTPELKCFWDARAVAIAGQARNDPAPDENEAIEQLDALLRDSVKLRMIADVPLGAFLSGGIDSSTVVALMQAQSTRPVKTFSIGFHAAGYDEAQYAGGVAAHLHTDHTEFYVEPKHALELVPRLADWFDEPFADSSQIPALLISELTRKHVTVALSGDGGDELFAGYNRYLWAERFLRVADALPQRLHRPMAAALRALPPDTWTRLFRWLPFLPAYGARRRQAAQDRDACSMMRRPRRSTGGWSANGNGRTRSRPLGTNPQGRWRM